MKVDLKAISGLDWDGGNLEKIQKHGVLLSLLTEFFRGTPKIIPDLLHSGAEERFIAYGRVADRRGLFVVFTIRQIKGRRLIRPISARFMHSRELARYGKENP